jgi:PIN domain nuclease of toxin-antitoxin system
VGEPQRLSTAAREVIEDPSATLYWSAASPWEVALKASRRGLKLPAAPREFVRRVLDEEGILRLPIEDEHALQVLELPHHHRDPFDRMLVAQAQIEGLAMISSDEHMRSYEVEVLW